MPKPEKKNDLQVIEHSPGDVRHTEVGAGQAIRREAKGLERENWAVERVNGKEDQLLRRLR